MGLIVSLTRIVGGHLYLIATQLHAAPIAGEQIGRTFGYASKAGILGLIWTKNQYGRLSPAHPGRHKYNHTPMSRCYLGYAAMTQILEAIQRASRTDTAALIKALEGHEFDGLKEGKSLFRASDHQHVQNVLVGETFGRN